jgi:hypothetical protein
VFNKLFGKKNEGFYLQIEEDNNSPKLEAKATAKSQPPAATADAPAVVVTPATISEAKADQAEATTKKKSVKKADSKKVEATPAAVTAPAPVTAPAITNFATDYLIKPSSTSSRRQPGANMNMFLDLARQVQKPANIKK